MNLSDESTDPGIDLIPGYCPYIADVPIEEKAEPFPKQNQPVLTEDEIAQKKKSLKKYLKADKFRKPVQLKDFMLIAKDRWALEEEQTETKCGNICNID